MPVPEPVNPAIYAGMKWLVIALSSIIMMVLGKIVWDWLTGKSSRSAETKFCPMHDHMSDEFLKLDASLTAIRTRFVDRDEHRDAMTNIYNVIGKIDDKLGGMKDDLWEIRLKVAEIEPGGLPAKKKE